MAAQPGFFDVGERLQRLSDLGGHPEVYAAMVNFEIFRPDLEAALGYSDSAKGVRPPEVGMSNPAFNIRWLVQLRGRTTA